jgi:hypothetical protein
MTDLREVYASVEADVIEVGMKYVFEVFEPGVRHIYYRPKVRLIRPWGSVHAEYAPIAYDTMDEALAACEVLLARAYRENHITGKEVPSQ